MGELIEVYPVESGIPFPSKRRRGGRLEWQRVYDWDHMAINDSFLVTDRSMYTVFSAAGAANYRWGRDRKPGEPRMYFACRQRLLAEDGESGVRVWRIY